MNDFQKLTIWETVFVGAKPENVQKWFSNQEKDFLINISIILIVVGKVHWKVRNLSKLFHKSVKGEIFMKTFPKIPCLESISQDFVGKCLPLKNA